jgi:glutamyl-tRNA reductase
MDKPVVTDPETYRLSKVTPKDIEQVRKGVEKQVRERPPKARRKWEAVVTTESGRYAASCKDTQEAVLVTKVRQLHGRGKIPGLRG